MNTLSAIQNWSVVYMIQVLIQVFEKMDVLRVITGWYSEIEWNWKDTEL